MRTLVAIWSCLMLQLFFVNSITGQQPFDCSSQVWMLNEEVNEIVYLNINPSNNAIQLSPFVSLQNTIDAIAYRFNDRLLYGLSSADKALYSIDANGVETFVATVDLLPNLDHFSFGFDVTGNRMVFIGSTNEVGQQIEIVDFDTPGANVFNLAMPAGINVTDLSVNPINGLLYGVNTVDSRVVSFNPNNYAFRGYGIPESLDNFQGAYCNAFGEVFAFGSTQLGVASALFKINTNTGENVKVSTGPEAYMKDFASCPFSIGLYSSVNPRFTFPCNSVEYTYRIANATGGRIDNLRLESLMPAGFTFDDLLSNPLDGDTEFKDESFVVSDLTLQQGVQELSFTVEVGNVPADDYFHQFTVSGLPSYLGDNGTKVSDYPETVKFNDATRLEVKFISGDTVFQDFFFCVTADAILDGSLYGVEFDWFDGSDAAQVQVYETGIYELEAQSGCQSVVVVYDVTIASCPYTINLDHTIEPDTTYPCSEVIYNFILNNDTGSAHEGITFSDTLQEGLVYLDLLSDPFDGDDKSEGRYLRIEDMKIPLGIDTIQFLVEVGNIQPDVYLDQAYIKNFPPNLGSFRVSDDPATLPEDSTTLLVLGVEADSSFIELTLCKNETLTLDGSLYGFDFLWYDGTTEDLNTVDKPGVYELQIFTGCEVSYVFFDVMPGADIELSFDRLIEIIPLGDSIQLLPQIYNEGDSLAYNWTDPRDTTLSCQTCLEPYANPYLDTNYWLYANNEVCKDSIELKIEVDNTRRLYLPNIISESEIGVNSEFFIQTPDYTVIEEFIVYDRYGSIIYENNDADIATNVMRSRTLRRNLSYGVYVWYAKLTFLDGLTETFTGTITIIE